MGLFDYLFGPQKEPHQNTKVGKSNKQNDSVNYNSNHLFSSNELRNILHILTEISYIFRDSESLKKTGGNRNFTMMERLHSYVGMFCVLFEEYGYGKAEDVLDNTVQKEYPLVLMAMNDTSNRREAIAELSENWSDVLNCIQAVKQQIGASDSKRFIEIESDIEYVTKAMERWSGKHCARPQNVLYNPYGITENAGMSRGHSIPDMTNIFAPELVPQINRAKRLGNSGVEETKKYVIDMIESYHDNAGYVPMCIVDSLCNQIGKIATNAGVTFPNNDLKSFVLKEIYNPKYNTMNLFDSFLGNKKPRSSENQSQSTNQQSNYPSSISSNKTDDIFAPFIFESNQHQRYENGIPVQGLQVCPRTIKVEKNTNGCSGYQLKNGDGYIVRMINGDTGCPQMSPKPMRVVQSSPAEVVLRGYLVSAQTPFGYQDIDMGDYGLTVSLEEGKVVKCVLHMYDRNVDIEYRKVSSCSSSQRQQDCSITNITETELYVDKALAELTADNDGDEVYHPLYLAWRSFQYNPRQLKNIVNYGNFGKGMSAFLSYGTVSDIDDKQQIASIGYLFLSLAIQKNPNDVNLILNRLIIMLSNREALEYTVSSVVNKDIDLFMMNMSQLRARDSLFKMEYADLLKDHRLLSVDLFANAFQNIKSKIQSGFFGRNETDASIIKEGEELHNEITEYLRKKVLEDNDIDF